MGIAPFRRKLTSRWRGNCDNFYLEKFKPEMSIKICCVFSDLNTMPDCENASAAAYGGQNRKKP